MFLFVGIVEVAPEGNGRENGTKGALIRRLSRKAMRCSARVTLSWPVGTGADNLRSMS
jgi:hypothetical protein